jgi:TPR repeat protein
LVAPEAGSPLFGVYEALRKELVAKLVEAGEMEAGAVEGREVRSLIVLAYASALLNLGWRYEHGRGLMRNLAEAGRCYAKAGRLGESQ